MVKRTALITAASVAGVVLAGAAVVGANVGVLSSSQGTDVGALSATTVPTAEDVVAAGADQERRTYAVADAGTVQVQRTGDQLSVTDVAATSGWTHAVQQTTPSSLTVTLSSGDTSYGFQATIGPDGRISAGATRPVDPPGSSATAGTVQREHDSHELDDPEHEELEHAGGDDDD